jgi:hypothetical protein
MIKVGFPFYNPGGTMNHKPRLFHSLFCLSVLWPVLSALLFSQTSPAAFLGHPVGADRKLADYGQIKSYLEKLDQESPRLQLLEIGSSTLKKPIVMAVITSEKNMARLDAYRDISRKLRNAGALAEEQAQALAREGKTIVLITCSLHASEIAASQMAMELAYDLVSGKTPFDAAKVLDDVIVLLVPSSNPDGQVLITEWYRKYMGTKFEGGSMPWLYHPYAGHDNNRDWFMFNLSETRAITKVLYHDWLPQVHIDEHQMGSTGSRLFLPPFMDPPVPNVQPALWRGVNLLGTHMAYDLQQSGFKGVSHGRSFTGWWIGACDDTSWLHNVIGLLSEMASVRIASPIYIEPTEIPNSYVEKRMEIPDPWMGGWWRLRDLVDYELTLSKSLIRAASLRKEDLLFNSYRMYRNSIRNREPGEPYAFVIPKRQHDYPTAIRMLEVLQFGGVEIQQAKEDFLAEGKSYPAGSFVVLLSQPYKPFAWALLERQKYPDLRQFPGGPPIPPYDNAGWTLPLQMGVTCDPVKEPFQVRLEKWVKPDSGADSPPAQTPYLVLDSRINSSYSAAYNLVRDKAEVWRSREPVAGKGFDAAAGSFLIKNSPEVTRSLTALQNKWHMPAYSLADIASLPKDALKHRRIALYQSWKDNMDEGWTRYFLDDFGIAYTTLHNSDLKGKKEEKINLKEKYDVILFADESADVIKTGKPSPTSEYARHYTPLPPEYEGGIEKEGIDALKAFVEQGGILVLLNGACELGFKELEVPAQDVLSRLDPSKFFCPTSILRILVDNTKPIGYGMPPEAAAVFSDSVAMSTSIPSGEWDRSVVAGFPKEEVLLSGWLLGESYLTRKAAVVDTTYKNGHIILIGIRSQLRAQSHGTYKFVLNALLYPEAPVSEAKAN